jgi:hypothetical protein
MRSTFEHRWATHDSQSKSSPNKALTNFNEVWDVPFEHLHWDHCLHSVLSRDRCSIAASLTVGLKTDDFERSPTSPVGQMIVDWPMESQISQEWTQMNWWQFNRTNSVTRWFKRNTKAVKVAHSQLLENMWKYLNRIHMFSRKCDNWTPFTNFKLDSFALILCQWVDRLSCNLSPIQGVVKISMSRSMPCSHASDHSCIITRSDLITQSCSVHVNMDEHIFTDASEAASFPYGHKNIPSPYEFEETSFGL